MQPYQKLYAFKTAATGFEILTAKMMQHSGKQAPVPTLDMCCWHQNQNEHII